MLSATDLPGVPQDVARRVIASARSIAPCIDTLEGDAKKDALAILQGCAAELPATGSRRVRSQARNGTSITFETGGSMFTQDDRDALRALCAAATATTGAPVGVFPPSGVTERIWPPEATR